MQSRIEETIEKIRALRNYTERSGFRTTRSEKELLARLGPDELADVLMALENGTDAHQQ